MNFYSKIILDSINCYGKRLITVECRYPRIIHSELMTHRVFSRNSASSRAIKIEKLLEQVSNNPFVPEYFGKNQSGMQALEEISERDKAKEIWLQASELACQQVKKLLQLNVHKQTVNRILEPFSFITVIITATEWDNFFNLRNNHMAQPEFQKIASLIKESIDNSKPKILHNDEYRVEWHLPYIQEDEQELPLQIKQKISIARCARVSYLTHDGKRNHNKDIELYDRLLNESHMSPFEHVARPSLKYELAPGFANYSGNFHKSWAQYRKLIEANHKETNVL